jgi:hypothetical protein
MRDFGVEAVWTLWVTPEVLAGGRRLVGRPRADSPDIPSWR